MAWPMAIGADWGQSRDRTVFAVCELAPGRSPAEPVVHLVHLQSLPLGTDFQEQVRSAVGLWRACYFRDAPLVSDAGGLGAPNRDALRAQGVDVIGVKATGGDHETLQKRRGRQQDWTVGRVHLLQTYAGLLHTGRFKIASDLAEGSDLLAESADLQVRISAAGVERVEVASTTHHADRVSAVALAAWWLCRPPPKRVRWVRNPIAGRC